MLQRDATVCLPISGCIRPISAADCSPMTETLRGWWPRSTFRRLVAGLAVGLAVLLVGASSVVLHPKSYSSGATLVFLDATSVQELSLELGERVSSSGAEPVRP